MTTDSGHLPECPCDCDDCCICPALRACEARLYTLMGAAIQSGIEAEQKRIRFAIAALVDGEVIDLSLSEYRAVVNAINEEES